MTDKEVIVVAQIRAKDGMAETVKQELAALVDPTLSENGCLAYALHQSIENQSLFMFYEKWVSKKDLDEHMQMPHMKAHLKKAKDLLAEPPKITLWEVIR